MRPEWNSDRALAAAARSFRISATVIVGLTLWRLYSAATIGLGDAEAYYWTWSRRLALGYFDHGPVVAWLIRAGTALWGDTPFGVRFFFVLLSAGTLLLMARLGASGQRPALGPLALAAFLSMPMVLIAGAAANPDVPLAFLTCALLALLLPDQARLSRCRLVAAALCCGLAIATKLFALCLLPPLLVCAARCQRPRWSIFAALMAVALAASPVVLWNALHGWASLRYHLSERHSAPVGLSLLNLAKLVGGQLAYVGPVTALACLALFQRAWRQPALRREPLLLFAVPPLLAGFALIAIVPGAEPHWPAIGYLPLLVLLARQLHDQWSQRAVRLAACSALGFAALAFVLFHLHVMSDLGVRLMPPSYQARFDISNELWGWPTIGRQVEALAAASVDPRSGRRLVLGAAHYTTCSQLAFSLSGRRWTVRCPSPRRDQFDFSPEGDGQALRGVDLGYLWDYRFPFATEQLYRCRHVEKRAELRLRRAGRVVRHFQFFVCRDFQGLATQRWPPAAIGAEP